MEGWCSWGVVESPLSLGEVVEDFNYSNLPNDSQLNFVLVGCLL